MTVPMITAHERPDRESEILESIEEELKIIERLGLESGKIEELTSLWRTAADQEPARFITDGTHIDAKAMHNFWRSMLFVSDAPSGKVGELSLRNMLGGTHRGSRKWLRAALALVKERGFDGLLRQHPCPTIGDPHVFRYQGFRFTMRWISHIYLVSLMNEILDDRIGNDFVAMDIGSSFGVFSSLVKKVHPNSHIVLVDFPEQLILAHYFLGRLFPEARIAGLNETSDQAQVSREFIQKHDFVLVPCQLYPRLADQSIDLVTNTASLGEMSRSWFDYYIKSSIFKTAKYFFTFNRIQSSPTYETDLTVLDYPIWDPNKRLHFAVSPLFAYNYARRYLFFSNRYAAPPCFEYAGAI